MRLAQARPPVRLSLHSVLLSFVRLALQSERSDARGRDGGARQELAAGVVQLKPTTEVQALPSLDVKTARSCRGILPSTHLAREGRMTVTIGRRELLVAFGGAAVAWPLAASGPRRPRLTALSRVSARLK